MDEQVNEHLPENYLTYKLEAIEQLADSIIGENSKPDGAEPSAEVCLAYDTKYLLKLFKQKEEILHNLQEVLNGKAIHELGVSDIYLKEK